MFVTFIFVATVVAAAPLGATLATNFPPCFDDDTGYMRRAAKLDWWADHGAELESERARDPIFAYFDYEIGKHGVPVGPLSLHGGEVYHAKSVEALREQWREQAKQHHGAVALRAGDDAFMDCDTLEGHVFPFPQVCRKLEVVPLHWCE